MASFLAPQYTYNDTAEGMETIAPDIENGA